MGGCIHSNNMIFLVVDNLCMQERAWRIWRDSVARRPQMKQEAGNLLQQDHDCMLMDVTNIFENI